MPKATNGKLTGRAPSESLRSSGRVSRKRAKPNSTTLCESEFSVCEKQYGNTLENFVSATGSGGKFYIALERAQSHIESAERMQSAENDLDLNESSVLADRALEELLAAERLVAGAYLSETEAEWAEEFERAKTALDRMGTQVKKMKSNRVGAEGEAMEIRGALLNFRRERRNFAARMSKLKETLSNRNHAIFSTLESLKRGAHRLKAGAGQAFDRLAKRRLRKHIDRAKLEITSFMKGAHTGRIFVDHKHLTLWAGEHKTRIPLSQPVRFALEEIAPLQKQLARLGKSGGVVLGSFENDGNAVMLRIGHRSVAGDSVIYREQTHRL